MTRAARQPEPLRIVHVLRAPLGGLFRHVVDLAEMQARRGHQIGLVTDASTGGPAATARIEALREHLTLGVLRLPMQRLPHVSDALNLRRIHRHLRTLNPHVVHGHGAKGGLYARAPALLKRSAALRAYTPHGGSFNFRPGTSSHRAFMAVEDLLARATDLLLFESNYIRQRFDAYVGAHGALQRTIVNGLSEEEFTPITPNADAADLLYVGELRAAKGIDTLLDALAIAASSLGRAPSVVLVGSGPDEKALIAHAQRCGIADGIRFVGPMPARTAFRLGRVLVVPSRAESLPYVVLEAAAARVPMIATKVGGIPEIFGPHADRLVRSDDPALLAEAIMLAVRTEPAALTRCADALANYVASRFTMAAMADGVLAGYADARRQRDERHRLTSPLLSVPN